MRIVIIEDEAPAVRRLEKMVHEALPTAEIVARLDSVSGAIAYFQTSTLPAPDLALVDIQLADGLSFEIFEQVAVNVPIIFTTAYDAYALRAFKVNSIDYLLKPINKEELQKALHKWQQLHQNKTEKPLQEDLTELIRQLKDTKTTAYKARFLVKMGEKLVSIPEQEIAYFQAEDKIVFLHTQANRKYVLDYTLDELEEVLNPTYFFRLNRQFIAHVQAIKSINTYFNGKLKLQLLPDTQDEVIVSREKSPLLKDWLDR